MKVTIHRLSNGLTVYISPDHSEPRISANVVVRAGSRTDPSDSTGLAHYLEHMLFKGTAQLGTLDAAAERPHVERIARLYDQLYLETDPTRRLGLLKSIDDETQTSSQWLVPNEFDTLTAALGFSGLNAFTSDDRTGYVVNIPSNRLEQWARLEAERFAHPVFRLFLQELEAVYEEKNSSIDSPERRALEALDALLYPRHPYGTQTTIGRVEHLKNPAYRKMVEYFQRWYRPNNMAVVLAGDVDPATALPVLERHLSALEARPLPPLPPAELPPLHGRAHAEVEAEGQEVVYLAWPTVAVGHDDELAVMVMDLLMSDASAGLLNSELVLPQKLPAAVSSVRSRAEAGAWMVIGTARTGQKVEEIERLLLATVAKLKAGAFDEREVAAAVLNEEIRHKRGLEDKDRRASWMMSAFTNAEPWGRVVGREQRLRGLTKADIVRVANRYLGDDFASVYRRKGTLERAKIPKPAISAVKMDPSRRSAFARQMVGEVVRPIEPRWLEEGSDYRRATLSSGPLIVTPNPYNDLFALTYRFETGHRRTPLLCFATEVQQSAGAGALSAAELQRRLYALGATVSVSCGADETSIMIEGIDRHMEETLALARSWFGQARFSDQDVATRLATVKTARQNALEDPRSAAGALSAFAQLGADSPYLTEPTNATLEKATTEQLQRLLASLPDQSHHTLYFGPRPLAQARRAVVFGTGQHRLPPRPPVRLVKPRKPTLWLLDRQLAQAQISMMFPAPPSRHADLGRWFALSQYVGGGMQSLLFREIREARGLAYSVQGGYSTSIRPRDDSGFSGYIATQPDKARDAITSYIDVLRDAPVLPESLATTKANLEARLASQRFARRRIPGIVDAWEQQGDLRDPRPRVKRDIEALLPGTVRRMLSTAIHRPFTIGLTAEKSRLDLEALGKLATIKEVAVTDLFSYAARPAQNDNAAGRPPSTGTNSAAAGGP